MSNEKIDWSQYEVKDADEAPIDWSQYEVKESEPKQQEGTGLFGVLGDFAGALRRGQQFALDIPNKLEKSGRYIEKNPFSSILHNAAQMGAETAEIGKGIINAPYNLNQYLARKHLLPSIIGKGGKFIPHIPDDTGIEKALGLQPNKERGDELFRAVPELAAALSGTKALSSQGLQKLKKFTKAPDLKQAVRDLQKNYEIKDRALGKTFDQIENEIYSRGTGQINYDPDIIDRAEGLLNPTKANKQLLADARTGDFKSIRKLESTMREESEKNLSSELSADRNLGEHMSEVRNDIIDDIDKHLETTKNDDLAKLLKQTKGGYQELQNLHFSNNALAKIFSKKTQEVPRNPQTTFTVDNKQINAFKEAHPEFTQELEKFLKHEGKMKMLKKVLAVLGSGVTGGATFSVLHK